MPSWPRVQYAVTTSALAVLCPVAVAAGSASMAAPTAAVTASRMLQDTVVPRVAICDVYDFNDSGGVDVADLLLCLGAFGRLAEGDAERFAVSGGPSVSVSDLLLVLGAFGMACPQRGAPAPGATAGVVVDACGCADGEGWSSSIGACVAGAHTSVAETMQCDTRPPPTARDSCTRLAEYGLDCGACLSIPPGEPSTCTPQSAAEDQAAEFAALWGDRTPRDLYNQTQFLWDEDAGVRTIGLEMDTASWRFLADDPQAEEYIGATVHLGELGSWQNVGVRFKGYYGSLRGCFRARWGNSGRAFEDGSCNKLSLKLKFNFVDRSQRFFGLKKVMLHASLSDTTLMRERLAYSLFREMGVAAPRSAHIDVQLRLSDAGQAQPLGLHLLTEQIDSRFTDTYFRGGDNNVWKEAWPGLERSEYEYLLETNEDTADTSRFEEFGAALEAAATDWDLVQVATRYMKVDSVARYWAVDRAIEHWDGPVNFRDDFMRRGQGFYWNHNYFMAESDDGDDQSSSQFWIVPWDMDGTFPENPRNGPWRGGRPDWDQPVDNCRTFSSTNGMSQQVAPSCSPLIRAFARGLRSQYMQAAEELLRGPLGRCRIQSKLDRWQAAVEPFMAADAAAGLYPAKDGQRGRSCLIISYRLHPPQ